jgi:hypothetical protein
VGDDGAVLVLLLATVLGVYKPWGRTPFFLAVLVVIVAVFIVVHLAGGGLGLHRR